MKTLYIFLGGILLFVVLLFWSKSLEKQEIVKIQTEETDSEIISINGLHWHPLLSITVDGELYEIPDNVGLIGGHMPMHTHDRVADIKEAGEFGESYRPIHLEYGGKVTKDDTRLGNFFNIWGKTFNRQCIFDFCTDNGTLEMYINGEKSEEFENYRMNDRDKIEIIYNSFGHMPTSADNAPLGSMHNLPVPEAVAVVRKEVAKISGVSEGLVIVMTAYEKDWSDTCLGLAGEDETCGAAITPGYEVTLTANGKTYIYHTNENGSAIRRKE